MYAIYYNVHCVHCTVYIVQYIIQNTLYNINFTYMVYAHVCAL